MPQILDTTGNNTAPQGSKSYSTSGGAGGTHTVFASADSWASSTSVSIQLSPDSGTTWHESGIVFNAADNTPKNLFVGTGVSVRAYVSAIDAASNLKVWITR